MVKTASSHEAAAFGTLPAAHDTVLKLEDFLPHRLNVLSSLVSEALTRVYGRYHLEEDMVDWPPLVIVNYDPANEEITHTFFRGRNWTNEEFLRAFPKPCAILAPETSA